MERGARETFRLTLMNVSPLQDNPMLKADLPVALEGLPEMKPEDMNIFGKLLQVRYGTGTREFSG
jgi:hypothetical protein